MRSSSKVTPQKQYDKNQWVVSIINTTRSLTTDGHSALVVEGLDEKGQPFVGQYDIGTAGVVPGSGNEQGYITAIKCHENEKNTRDYAKEKFPAESFVLPVHQVKQMIDSIKMDEEHTRKARENASNELKDQPIIHRYENGNPIRYLKYQKLGKDHPLVKLFGNPKAGDNCTGWCVEKLKIAGIDLTESRFYKPKPAMVSGQLSLSSFFTRRRLAFAGTGVVVTAIASGGLGLGMLAGGGAAGMITGLAVEKIGNSYCKKRR